MEHFISTNELYKKLFCFPDGSRIPNTDCNNFPISIHLLDLRKIIASISTVDVEKVTRCKNCIYYQAYQKPVEDFDGCCIIRECETDEEEYCSYGKDKD